MTEIGTISSIVQDKYGFVWVGGQSGLARFDGYDLQVYEADQDNPDAISSNLIWDLMEDREGNLWVATAWGVNRFDHHSQHFKTKLIAYVTLAIRISEL